MYHNVNEPYATKCASLVMFLSTGQIEKLSLKDMGQKSRKMHFWGMKPRKSHYSKH